MALKRNKFILLLFFLSGFIFSCCANEELSLSQLNSLKEKYIIQLQEDDNLPVSEKSEGMATINSIYSFCREMACTDDDFYNPYVLEWILPDRKFAGDNPDTQYFSFFIDPEAEYEVEVSHDNVFFMEITSYTRKEGQNMISNSLVVSNNISKLRLSQNNSSSVHMRLSDKDYMVMIRYYKDEAKKISPKPVIKCINRSEKGKKVDKEKRFSLALALFESLYQSSVLLTGQMKQEVNDYVEELDMDNSYVKNLYPAKSNVYNGAFIHIPKGKYLSVKGKINKDEYAAFVFYNRWWATPFYNRGKTYLNTKQLITDEYGNYEIFISGENMEKENTIILDNIENGILSIRSIFKEIEEPVLELKSLNDK